MKTAVTQRWCLVCRRPGLFIDEVICPDCAAPSAVGKLVTLLLALLVASVSAGILAWYLVTHWPTQQSTEKLMHPTPATVMLVAYREAPSITDEVCGAFNMGLSPDQIIAGLERNDGRFNYWRAQRSTIWPIIQGECEPKP